MRALKVIVSIFLFCGPFSGQIFAQPDLVTTTPKPKIESIAAEDLVKFLRAPSETHFIHYREAKLSTQRAEIADQQRILEGFEHRLVVGIDHAVMVALYQKGQSASGIRELRALSVEDKSHVLAHLHLLDWPEKAENLVLKLAPPQTLIPQLTTAIAKLNTDTSDKQNASKTVLYRALFEAWILEEGLVEALYRFRTHRFLTMEESEFANTIFSDVANDALSSGIWSGGRNLVSATGPQRDPSSTLGLLYNLWMNEIPDYRKLKGLTAAMRNADYLERIALAKMIIAAGASKKAADDQARNLRLWFMALFRPEEISLAATTLMSEVNPAANLELWRLYVDFLPNSLKEHSGPTLASLRRALGQPLADSPAQQKHFAHLVLPTVRHHEAEKFAQWITPEIESAIREKLLGEPEGKIIRAGTAVVRHCLARKRFGF